MEKLSFFGVLQAQTELTTDWSAKMSCEILEQVPPRPPSAGRAGVWGRGSRTQPNHLLSNWNLKQKPGQGPVGLCGRKLSSNSGSEAGSAESHSLKPMPVVNTYTVHSAVFRVHLKTVGSFPFLCQ